LCFTSPERTPGEIDIDVSDFPQPGKERMVSTVKKFLAMLLVGAVLFTGVVSLTGCSSEDKDKKEKKDKEKKEEKKEKDK
jgi:hypothetical protein